MMSHGKWEYLTETRTLKGLTDWLNDKSNERWEPITVWPTRHPGVTGDQQVVGVLLRRRNLHGR